MQNNPEPTELQKVRESILINEPRGIEKTANSKKRMSVRESIAQASCSFKLREGTEAADLVIENERLKTTLQILNQKLKV